jgi:hypothetical protein
MARGDPYRVTDREEVLQLVNSIVFWLRHRAGRVESDIPGLLHSLSGLHPLIMGVKLKDIGICETSIYEVFFTLFRGEVRVIVPDSHGLPNYSHSFSLRFSRQRPEALAKAVTRFLISKMASNPLEGLIAAGCEGLHDQEKTSKDPVRRRSPPVYSRLVCHSS